VIFKNNMDANAISIQLTRFDVALDQWKLQVLTGKRVLTDIISTVYPTDVRLTEELTDQLETRLQDLKFALVLMEKVVQELKTINIKLKARLELSLLSNPKTHLLVNEVFVKYEDILVWTQSITADLEEQFSMNSVIFANICHLGTRNQALFHQGVWTLQPGLKPQSEQFLTMIRHISQQESSS
jgi:hypothetical protein